MIQARAQRLAAVRVNSYVGIVTLAAGLLFLLPVWRSDIVGTPKFLNGLVAFAALGILCETSFLRISFANVGSSVAFVPFLASVALFQHPWPMIIGGVTAAVVDTLVRHKPLVRVWFNSAQYMLAIGLGALVYRTLGGQVSMESFSVDLVPFLALVVTFFIVNTGSVAVAVALSSGVSARESWDRIVGRYLVWDFIASFLAMLLVFVYVKLQIVGLALVILPLFFVRHMYQMNEELEKKNQELLEVLVERVEDSDPYTSGHSRRVAEYARTMSRELGLSAKQVDEITKAALLHDVGKAYSEFAPLLKKEGRLSPEERIIMQSHPVRSAELVGRISELRGTVQHSIKHHHENFDGTGYPDGLAGEQIPIGARIIMIADTLDAMTTDRPYRKALSFERVIEEVQRYAGRQFDPRLAEVLVRSAAIRRLLGTDQPVSIQFSPGAVTRPTLRRVEKAAV